MERRSHFYTSYMYNAIMNNKLEVLTYYIHHMHYAVKEIEHVIDIS